MLKKDNINILIIGGGGREHALLRAIKEERTRIYTLPERKSIPEALNISSSLLENWSMLLKELKQKSIHFVLIGLEQPLVEGLGDFLRKNNILVFGPSAQAARLEGSKLFAKEFMKSQNIPTASYKEVTSLSQTLEAAEKFSPPYVLKADGLAGGKGVFICQKKEELENRARQIFEEKIFGEAGNRALLEEFQEGREMSVFVLTNGEGYTLLPVAQDYKRLNDGQIGPNTGGMGAIAPLSVSNELMENIENQIIRPTIQGLKKNKYQYRGILYIGLMVSQKKPKVLEYNVRFGDPEAQVLLPLLDGSWLETFYQVAEGTLPSLQWKNIYSACVVLTANGYPEKPLKGNRISGSIHQGTPDTYFLHAGVGEKKGEWVVNGGRVLNSVALGTTLEEALNKAYKQVNVVFWEGMHYRKDIGVISE